jgi:transcriptional regulator with XRE-family HTH domain
MNIEDVKSYHGYLALPRHSFLLIHELEYDLFGFYVGLVMLAEWHRNSKDFRYITKTQEEIAEKLKMTQATVSRKMKMLENHKYFILRHVGQTVKKKDKKILLGYLPLFLTDVANKIHSKDYTNLHELYADMYRINAELQEEHANLQDKRTQKARLSFNNSSIDNSSSSQPYEEDIDSEEADRWIEAHFNHKEEK